MFEYKVLTEHDSRFAGKFDPDVLENALNIYAAEGWRVVETFLAASLWKSINTEIIVILERSKSQLAWLVGLRAVTGKLHEVEPNSSACSQRDAGETRRLSARTSGSA